MKKLIRPQHIEIIVDIEYFEQLAVAASTYKGFQIPDGPLISGIPEAVIDSQALVDYESFIESVTDLITDYYELHIYYKNTSPDHSNYFGMLVKNDDGILLIDFDFTLRISNHNPHRSQQSQQHKKERKKALAEVTQGKKTKPITSHIEVNKENFDTYLEAYIAVDKLIGDTVEKMKQNQKYR